MPHMGWYTNFEPHPVIQKTDGTHGFIERNRSFHGFKFGETQSETEISGVLRVSGHFLRVDRRLMKYYNLARLLEESILFTNSNLNQ